MTAAPKRPAQKEPQPNPDVCKGDHVYFRHPKGPHAAEVLCTGRHGITVRHEGQHHRVKWEHVLGHKTRKSQKYNVLDEGEDGLIVQDEDGQRRYINVPPEARGEKMVLGKAFGDGGGRLVIFAKGGPIKNRPGLTLKDVTDKTGKQTKHWVRTNKDMPSGEREGGPPDAGAQHGYGTHNLQPGDTVSFKNGDHAGEGKIHTVGEHGAVVHDAAGGEHRVLHSHITGHKPADGTTKPAIKSQVRGDQKPIPDDQFDATAYAKSHDDPEVTPEAIIADFPPDTSAKIEDVQKRLKSIEQTIHTHMEDGEYTAERTKLHQKIYEHFLSAERITAATPSDGEQPTFTILGGRGGSGKSWFEGKVYDPEKAIVLDADHIKGMLPEYEGWNAEQVHEESSQVLESVMNAARQLGVNVVLDATMKTAKGAVQKVQDFKSAGFRVEAHYMHLPRQEAAKRAVARFLGKTQRYVPVSVVLSNTTNEASFDQVKKLADKWSFRDNNVPQGSEPILISESGNQESGGVDTKPTESQAGTLTKSEQRTILFTWKPKK
jgi:predicted ABC-type ATPase